ncbi:MAG: hypothetical protein KC503_02785 [Myxococcales bacterium]|nr:hypothetical protein [Myxococcales bacterium]
MLARALLGAAVLLCGSSGCSSRSLLSPRAIFDRRSFAFDVATTPGGDVVCALLEGGRYRLARFARGGARRATIDIAAAEAWVYDVAVSADGKRAALAARQLGGINERPRSKLVASGLVVRVDLERRRVLARHRLARPARAVRFAPDGALLVGLEAGPGERGLLCRISARGEQRCVSAHDATVSALATTSTQLISGSWDRTVRLWRFDLTPAPQRARLTTGGIVNALDARDDLLAIATSDQPPRRSQALVDAEKRGDHRRGPLRGAVELWQLGSRTRRYRTPLHHVAASAVALLDTRDAPRTLPLVASGGWDFRVVVSRGARVLGRLEGLSQIVTGLAAATPHGLALAAWSESGSKTPSCALLRVTP